MRAIALNPWCWRFLPEEAVGSEIRLLNEVAFVRLLKLRVFYDLLEGNVLRRGAVLPSAVAARDVVMNAHAAHKRCILILLALIANQVGKTVASLHRSINPIEKPLKCSILIVVGVADVENRNAAVMQPVGDFKGRMKYLGSFVPGKPANHSGCAAPGQELSCVKFVVERYAVNVSKMLAPAFKPLKNFIPLCAGNANG